jgi:hypothetical protein
MTSRETQMTLEQIPVEVDYPESDGRPMGETDLHRDWMVRLIDMLQYHYRGRPVYVSGDLLVYYERGMPTRFLVPDVFVVKDCEQRRRRVFKIWDEQRVPHVVLEVTSRATQREDEVFKPKLYEQIGVRELFLYDPTSDYLDPPLQGYRLASNGYSAIPPYSDGSLASEELNLLLHLDGNDLLIHDRSTHNRLLTEAEAQRQAKEKERQAKEKEQLAREEERMARLAAEAEVQRLRRLLAERGQDENQ